MERITVLLFQRDFKLYLFLVAIEQGQVQSDKTGKIRIRSSHQQHSGQGALRSRTRRRRIYLMANG